MSNYCHKVLSSSLVLYSSVWYLATRFQGAGDKNLFPYELSSETFTLELQFSRLTFRNSKKKKKNHIVSFKNTYETPDLKAIINPIRNRIRRGIRNNVIMLFKHKYEISLATSKLLFVNVIYYYFSVRRNFLFAQIQIFG